MCWWWVSTILNSSVECLSLSPGEFAFYLSPEIKKQCEWFQNGQQAQSQHPVLTGQKAA